VDVHPARLATTTRADPSEFTGEVWRTVELDAGPDSIRCVRFDCGVRARSFWHSQASEQVLYVTDGRGVVVWDGVPDGRELHPHDWVHVTPGVAHWHGATGEATFSHLAVNTPGSIDWLRPVTDEEYDRVLTLPRAR
jgi:quercetin dioxygenase-like cupin family protein